HGEWYDSWDIHQGGFRYFEHEASLVGEQSIEGKSVIATSESGLSVLEVVAISKDLSDLERGFRQLKDVRAMRPIDPPIEPRVKAPIFMAALALWVQRLRSRRQALLALSRKGASSSPPSQPWRRWRRCGW
ncbi:MAG: hypothetical protein JO161_06550, partial [Planctomycetaceae bacterium]|nr:hypothetical protein [Planctomycetaceae bacterium]